MKRAGPLLFLLGTALLLAAGSRAQEPERQDPAPLPATIVYRDGRLPEKTEILAFGSLAWASAQDLATIFRAVRFWRSDVGKLTFRFDQHEITLTVDSEVAVLDGNEVVHLGGPVLYRGGRVWVPLSALFDAEGRSLPWIPQPVTWERSLREIQVGGALPTLTGVQEGGDERLDIVVSEPRDFRVISATRSRFIIRIPGVSFERGVPVPAGSENFLAVTVSPVPGGAEISFAVPDTMAGYQVLRMTDPHRIAIVLSDDMRFVEEGRIDPFLESVAGAGLDIRVVAIDPGHGGRDRGAAASGLVEADLALGLARELALLLESRLGVRAVLTRDSDRDLAVAGRTEVANMAGADLFLSLHYDNWPGSAVRGPRAVVMPKRSGQASTVGGALEDLGFREWGGDQAAHSDAARLLAQDLVTAVAGALDEPSRGVEEWSLPVLGAASMPAVFLEIESLSAAGAGRRLTASDVDRRLAEAIVGAIERHRKVTP